jgi:hypothetical protein
MQSVVQHECIISLYTSSTLNQSRPCSHDCPSASPFPFFLYSPACRPVPQVKSSYDYQFAKPALRWLFNDYYGTVSGLPGGGSRSATCCCCC